MKFPLADRPFTRLYLTPDRHDELMSLVHANLMAALMEYEHLSLLQHAHGGISLGKPRFKTVKSRENLTVVKDKNDLSLDWSLPRLLMVGTVVGTLDDIMYGTLAPTAEAMRIRSAYVHDDMVDADVLCTLTSPSVDHPFEFLGIKWAVRYHATALNPMVSPRDSVVVEATGIHTTQSGERLGYRVVHSVNLPECPELKGTHGIIRTRLSSTALFKQLPNGVVDVYMTRHVEAAGTNSLTESSTLTAAATSMLSVWKSVWCSQNKKLACAAKDGARKWAMQGGGDKIERLVVTTDDNGNYCCGLCLKHYRLYNSVITCQACNLMVCSKCQVGRKLGKINYLGEVTQYPVLFCKNCITRSLKESAFDVAKSECAHVDDKATTTTSSPPETSVEVDPQLQTTTRSGATMPKMSIATNSTFAGSLDGLAMASYDDMELQIDLDVQTVDDWEREHDASLYMEQPPTLSASDSSELAQSQTSARGYATTNTPDDHQQQLWRQMTQLCMAAEETYLLTKKNADAMRHQRQAFA